MPELNYLEKWVPTKDEVTHYLNESQIFPLNVTALWFELLKLNNRITQLEYEKEKNKWI